ncbi:hypothetical protein GQX73_g7421 [Xylaria multiplex]|uniref:Uncharacterized protein n=1 Tax=Xylaria multiplex TaxID=323545 RepID=A0A7C8IQ30_9PEZI|nr:hypothetical protein GQX73_g7421 [Xylaria multiplex]
MATNTVTSCVYYSTLWKDARVDPYTEYESSKFTCGPISTYAWPPRRLCTARVDPPYQRPFLVYSDGTPMPPSDDHRFYISPEERARKAAEARWLVWQRNLCTGKLGTWRPEYRRWNGKLIQPRPLPPTRLQLMVENLTLFITTTKAAVKADLTRRRATFATRKAQLAFEISEMHYQLIQCRRAVAFEVRAVTAYAIARLKPVVLMALIILGLIIVALLLALWVGTVMMDNLDNDVIQNNLLYILAREYRSWRALS